MIRWMLQPHVPWERIRYAFLAALFMMPSLALGGFGIALLQTADTFDYGPSFDAMRVMCANEDVWGAIMLGSALGHVGAMLFAVRQAWILLLPHIFVFTVVAISMALGYGLSSPGMWLTGTGAISSMLTLICWRFLTNR